MITLKRCETCGLEVKECDIKYDVNYRRYVCKACQVNQRKEVSF